MHERTHASLVALRRILKATDQHARALSRSTGLTAAQRVLMQIIGEAGETTPKEIAARARISQATVTSLIDKLERRGFAIQAPRWTYIEPSIVFNSTISFLTLIMALLGGADRLWGPLLGAIPLFLLFEWLSANFPNHYPIILGLVFIAIVFVLPKGVLAALEGRLKKKEAAR